MGPKMAMRRGMGGGGPGLQLKIYLKISSPELLGSGA